MSICGVHLFETFRYSYSLVRKGSELFGVSAQTETQSETQLRGSELFGVSAQTDSGISILALLIYPTRNTFRYFYSLVRSGSELFGVSAQTDSGIRILALLINPTRS